MSKKSRARRLREIDIRIRKIAGDDWTAVAHRTAREKRWYCPGCGMVRAEESWGVTQVVDGRVIAHWKYLGTGTENKELCPGGEIDHLTDRAP